METQIRYISDLHRIMSGKKLTFVYEGRLNTEIINNLLHMAKTNLDSIGVPVRVKKKAYGILVEVLDSLHRQTKSSKKIDEKRNLHFPIVMMGVQGDHLYITTGSMVSNERAQKLREKFNQVNRLDKKNLKLLHMDALTRDDLYEGGFSDLALIDIALRSGHHLQYDFDFVNDKFQFYMLQVKVALEVGSKVKA